MYGCDSTVVLDLTVHPTYNDTITAEICDNEVYTQYNFKDIETAYDGDCDVSVYKVTVAEDGRMGKSLLREEKSVKVVL